MTLAAKPGQAPGVTTDTAPARPPRPIELAAIGLVLLAIVAALQWRVGAYGAEFTDDDSSHYISGLLIHDWITAGMPRRAVDFVRNYHAHYPLVGIGHWGPAYYAVEAAWMLVFSTGRAAMLMLSATVTAATALLTYALAARISARPVAALAALIAATSPIVQQGSSQLMLDMPMALACLVAMTFYARFLATGGVAASCGFALAAAFAILIKGNGACLALLPPFALILGARFDLLRRAAFWLPALIVGATAGPWYWLTYGQVAAGFRFTWGWTYTRIALSENTAIALRAVGPVVLIAGVMGFIAVPATSARRHPILLAAASLAAAVWIFQSLVPAAIQDRYLAPLLPPLLILAAHAVQAAAVWIAGRAAAHRPALRHPAIPAAFLAAALAVSFLPYISMVEARPQLGFIAAARQVWDRRIPANPAVLIAAHSLAEGAAIAELAMADPARPSLFAIRASRLLGGGGYNTQDYEPKFSSPEQVMAAIDDYAIPLLLIRSENAPREWAHIRQLEEAMALHPDRFHLIWQDGPTRLYGIGGNAARQADTARLIELSAPRALE